MAGRIIVRRSMPRDVVEVIPRWHETNRDAYPYVDAHQRHTLDDARAFFLARIVAECALFVAERDGMLAGMMAQQGSWIRQLAVFAPHRRRGVGRALLQAARAQSPTELRLFTFRRNGPARAFYEAEGFVAVRFGTSPPPENEPDVEYRWTAGSG